MKTDIIKLFCEVDDFLKQHEASWNRILLKDATKKRLRATSLSLSEIVTIVIAFHSSGFRHFK